MKIRMSFGIVKTVIMAIVLVGALAVIGLDIAMLAGANGVDTSSPAIAAVSLFAAVVICVATSLVLFNSYYKFKDEKYVAVLGFFVDKIAYDDILCIKQNTQTKELYAIVKSEKEYEGSMGFRINVAENKTDAFLVALREKKSDIVVELFTPEKKNKNKK